MSYPKQVDEAAELAEELHERMFNTADDEEAIEEDVVNDTEDSSDEVDEENDVPEEDDVAELRKFKNKYLTLKGKYEAEVPRLQHDLRDLKESIFERLEQTKQTQQIQQPQTKEPTKLDKFREEYGDDFVDSLKELFKAEVDPLLKSTLKPVQDQVSSVEETQIKVAQENFKSYLDAQVKGDWRILWEGKDPKFLEFLQKPDPSGLYTYSDLVQLYNDNWDADKLSTVLNSYLETRTQKVSVTPKVNKEREALVAPSRNNIHTTPNTEDKKIWNNDMISEFQKLDRQGKYSAEDSKAMWDDLLQAMAENRIRN